MIKTLLTYKDMQKSKGDLQDSVFFFFKRGLSEKTMRPWKLKTIHYFSQFHDQVVQSLCGHIKLVAVLGWSGLVGKRRALSLTGLGPDAVSQGILVLHVASSHGVSSFRASLPSTIAWIFSQHGHWIPREGRRIQPGIFRVRPREAQCYFCPVLLAKASPPKACPRGGEVDSPVDERSGMQERERKNCCQPSLTTVSHKSSPKFAALKVQVDQNWQPVWAPSAIE